MKRQHTHAEIHDALLRAQPQPDAETQRRLEERVIEALRMEHRPITEEKMNTEAIPYTVLSTYPASRTPQRSILTLAASLVILVIVGGLLTIRLLPESMRGLQMQTPPTLDSLLPITAENASRLEPLYTLGKGSLTGAQWSPDGQTIVLMTTNGLALHDADDLNADGQRLAGVLESRYSGGVMYSADSTRIAAITGENLPDAAELLDRDSENPDFFPYAYALTVWDAATGEMLAKIDGVSGRVVGFVADNTQVATETCAERVDGLCVDDQYALKFWDIASSREIVEKRYLFEEPPFQYNLTQSVAITADGQWLAYNSQNGNYHNVRLVNLDTPQLVLTLTERGNLPFTLSPDGKWLLVYHNDRWLMHAYDLETLSDDPTSTQPYSVHEYDPIPGINSSYFDWMKFSADGSRLVMHSATGQAVVFDPAPLFAQSGEFLDDASAFRQFPADAVMDLPGRPYYQQHLSPDGTKMLFQAIAGGTLMLFDLETGEKLQQSDVYHPYYFDIQFSDQTLAGSQIYWPDGKARLFDLSGQTPTEMIFPGDNVSGDDTPQNAMQVRLSAEGRYALYQNDNSFNTVASLMWMDRHMGRNYKLQSVMNNVATGFADDGSALILDSNSYVYRYNFDNLVSADGPTVTIVGERVADSRIVLQGTPSSGSSFMMRAAFSPDGRVVIVGTSNQLRVYDTLTGTLIARLDGLDFPQGREGISFSGEGRYVTAQGCISLNASSESTALGQLICDDPHVRVWDLSEVYTLLDTTPEIKPTSTEVLEIIPIVNFPVDVSTSIEGVASQPVMADDGSETQGFLVAAGDFFQTRVWFVKTVNSDDDQPAESQLLATLPGETQSLAFSPDETLLAVGGPGIVTLWGVRESE